MKKRFLLACILLAVMAFAQTALAAKGKAGISWACPAKIPEGASIVVADLGIHEGAATSDIAILHVGEAAGMYAVERFVDSGHFNVMECESARERLPDDKKLTGLIDPEVARQIGELLGVSYLVYGNVNDVTVSSTGTDVIGTGGVTVGTTKAHVILRMMDVKTGDIVTAAKGEGSSKTSYVRAGQKSVGYISIGTKKITQDSVHNAVQKAACQAVDVMVERLYGAQEKKKKKKANDDE